MKFENKSFFLAQQEHSVQRSCDDQFAPGGLESCNFPTLTKYYLTGLCSWLVFFSDLLGVDKIRVEYMNILPVTYNVLHGFNFVQRLKFEVNIFRS